MNPELTRKLTTLKGQLEAARDEHTRAEGAATQALHTLKVQFKVASLEDGRRKLKQLTAQREAQERTLMAKLTDIEARLTAAESSSPREEAE